MPRHSDRKSRLDEAKRLRRLRHYLQVSQRDLANEFKVGHGAISFWESGRRTIPGPILKLIEIYESELGLEKEDSGLIHIDSSWISRNFKLSSVMAQIAARVAGNSFQRLIGTDVEPFSDTITQKLGDAFGDLKGLLMKVGQMMSYTDFGMSDSAREKLITLQDRSAALDHKLIELVFETEIGLTPQSTFARFWSAPIGVGSIGQVHRATLADNSELAVKIQFPDIEASIDSDLKNTKFAEVLFPFLLPKQDSSDLLRELKDKFVDECDYRLEAKSQADFARIFASDPEIVVPKIYPKWSTKHVLTSQFLKGRRFSEFLSESTPEERNQAGKIIFRMAFESVFKHGILNCDPNPGNYIFLDQGKVGFIDFGCVKALDPKFVELWRNYILAFIKGDDLASNRIIIEMGYVPNPKTFDFKYHNELMRLLQKPWLDEKPFTFNREYVVSIGKKITIENPNRSKINLPKNWVFVNRLQWGLYSVLASLEAKADWRDIMLQALSEKI